jgi:hypothetical protein
VGQVSEFAIKKSIQGGQKWKKKVKKLHK